MANVHRGEIEAVLGGRMFRLWRSPRASSKAVCALAIC